MYRGGGPKLVELGARLGGDYITSLLIDNSIIGINMTEASIQLAMGEVPDISRVRQSGHSVAVKFIASQEGILKSISGFDEAMDIQGVISSENWGNIGKHYSAAHENNSRLGYVVAVGTSKAEAMQRCDSAISKIEIDMI